MSTMTASSNVESPKILLGLSALIISWFLFSYQGLVTAVEIWYISEIFQHCFFVVPGALYLIYLQRETLATIEFKPSWWALPFVVGQIVVYVVGVAGDIQLFMHLATFSLLPTLIWFAIGNKAAWHIVFPLCFMLFSIPVGEELIPLLQEITADISVYFLQLSGVPLYRSGLYIEIPEGRFLVAEACSGISFFIASIVIGNLYAYMNLRSMTRRVLFVGLSILYPILANAIRVYGIILTGHLTDMEHAVGADHLIYGWVFFAIVIVSLVMLGELFRRGDNAQTSTRETHVSEQSYSVLPTLSVIIMLALGVVWSVNVANPAVSPNGSQLVSTATLGLNKDVQSSSITVTAWQPQFSGFANEGQGVYRNNGLQLELYQVSYSADKGELVSFQNKLYDQDRWTLEKAEKLSFSNGMTVNKHAVTSVQSEKRDIYFAYWFDGQWYTSKTKVKLMQTLHLMGYQSGEMRMLALSVLPQRNASMTRQQEALVKTVFQEYLSAVDGYSQANILERAY